MIGWIALGLCLVLCLVLCGAAVCALCVEVYLSARDRRAGEG